MAARFRPGVACMPNRVRWQSNALHHGDTQVLSQARGHCTFYFRGWRRALASISISTQSVIIADHSPTRYSPQVVVVDLDHNRIVLPDAVRSLVPELPQPEHAILLSDLRKFLHNDLFYLDDYYTSSRTTASRAPTTASRTQSQQPSSPRNHVVPPVNVQSSSSTHFTAVFSHSSNGASGPTRQTLSPQFDEAIRYAFLMFFVSLLRNYREHLTYIRVFPEPMAIFNKRNFLHLRPDAAVRSNSTFL